MCGLTEQQRCEFAENALAERQEVLASLHQREQQFARWIAHQRSKSRRAVVIGASVKTKGGATCG